jgi:drug/metabolite transporter (DMT)-like permease
VSHTSALPNPSKPRALLWMVGWLTLMTIIAIAGREAGRQLSLFQVMEIRSLIGLILIIPLIWQAGGISALRTARIGQHAGRNVVHYAAQLSWFYALLMIPMGQVVAIEFTSPVWTAMLAAVLLGERITRWKVAAIVLGIVGVLVIVRPATDQINPGQALALGSAVGFAISIVLVKSLTRADNTVTTVFWMLVIQSVLGAIPCIITWQTPATLELWGWILVVAFAGAYSHFCMARAMLYADATTVLPMDFLRVPLMAAAGWLIYGERLDALTIVGAVLILAGNILNLKPATQPPRASA